MSKPKKIKHIDHARVILQFCGLSGQGIEETKKSVFHGPGSVLLTDEECQELAAENTFTFDQIRLGFESADEPQTFIGYTR